MRKLRDLSFAHQEGDEHSRHVAAASGLVRVDRTLFVVADDELQLAVFDLDDERNAYMIEILEGTKSGDKADLESVVVLPAFGVHELGALLILGSGSNENRRRGALVTFEAPAKPSHDPVPVDLAPLYEALEKEIDELNIEGAAVHRDRLMLLQRGNDPRAVNARIDLDLAGVLEALEASRPLPASLVASIDERDLGRHRGIDLAFSDITGIEDGRLVFAASTEATGPTSDGKSVGSAIGIMEEDGDIPFLEPVDVVQKIEGITARIEGDEISVLMVTDADHPDTPSPLLGASLAL